MKKATGSIPHFILASTCVMGVTMAHGQSSVNLYGTIDAGLIFSTNQQAGISKGSVSGGRVYQFGNGNLAPSRWGVTGIEDLGDGLEADFKLENQFLSGNGAMLQSNSLFDRQAWVGLQKASLGTVSLGRQYDSYSDFLGVYASSNSWASLYGTHFGDVDNLNEAFNMNNAVKFTSADFSGFTLGATYSFGGLAGHQAARSGYALALSYVHGPVSASAGYMTQRSPLDAVLGGSSGYFGDFSCSGDVSANYCALQDAASLHAYGAGGSMALGKATVALVYTHTRLAHSQYFASASDSTGSDVAFDIAELNTTYSVSPAWTLGAAYIFNNVKPSTTASTRFHQINVGTNYALSKRTALYLIGIAQKSSGHGLGISPTGSPTNYAEIPNLGNSASDRQLAVMAGVKADF